MECVVKDASDSKKQTDEEMSKTSDSTKTNSLPAMDFAAQMMASLSKLKETSEEKLAAPKSERNEVKSNNAVKKTERYIPQNPTILQTAATMGLEPSGQSAVKREVIRIKRPAEVEKTRYDLPVTAMEFEIMDAIRNHDVTIVCGETGSGKSTQVPQFLYEGGFSRWC